MKVPCGLVLFVAGLTTVVTVTAQEKGFKTDPASGVVYHFVKHDAKGIKPVESNFAHITMLWSGKDIKGNADTIFRNTHVKGFGDSLGAITIPLKSSFHGSLEQGILMMAKGDSAVFKVNADSLFLKAFHLPPDKLPAFVKSNKEFTFSIKLVSIQTKEEATAEKQAERQKFMKQTEARKGQESIEIATYLQKNNLTVKPDADSIFYLQTTKGTGTQVKEGDSLEVKYTGMFLDGKIFDKSDRGTGPGTFKILYTQNVPLIKGWISVLGKMNGGDKVRVLIPSQMAYGAHGGGPIQPYTPLIFDMELVTVKTNK